MLGLAVGKAERNLHHLENGKQNTDITEGVTVFFHKLHHPYVPVCVCVCVSVKQGHFTSSLLS